MIDKYIDIIIHIADLHPKIPFVTKRTDRQKDGQIYIQMIDR